MTDSPPPEHGDRFVRRQRERALRAADDAGRWIAERRPVSIPVDVAVRFYERDRDAFGSVLGSALAFRLFLLIIPIVLLVLGLVSLLGGSDVSGGVVSGAGLGGEIGEEVQKAMDAHRTTAVLLVGSGLFGSAWAGRGLTKVLAAVSTRSWELDPRLSRASVRLMGAVTGLLVLVVVLASVLNRIREASGLALAGVSLIGVFALYAAAWFVLTLLLPRGTSDPGAMLPGAAVFGITMAALQWFGQFYLPERMGSKSAVLGGLGVILVAMGWLFIVARVMAASLVLNAVIYERLGSVSTLVFDLPGLRRIPRRYPAIARFFDVHPD